MTLLSGCIAMGRQTWKANAVLRAIGTNFGLDDDSALLTEQGVQLAPGCACELGGAALRQF